MTAPRIEAGWLLVDCDAPDAAQVAIAIGDAEPKPAFRDSDADGQRIAKVRAPAVLPSRTVLTLIINGRPTPGGKTP